MERNALRTLWSECFGNEDGWIDAFFQTAFRPEQVQVLTRQGQLAAALSWMDVSCQGKKLAYLYAIATAPAFRGQGLCRGLMEKTHGELIRRNYAGAILVPADAGLRRMYARMGYRGFSGSRLLSARAGVPVAIWQLSPEEYADARRTCLPAGGVVQEAGAPDYLGTTARLYAGEDFLLAMSPEGFGVELLGNTDAAPGILGALGISEGTFRTPGEEPFAMYHSLTEDTWTPGYFGLAFD